MRAYKIVVLPGDGIGPEVIAQAVRVLEAVAEKSAGLFQLNLETHLIGGAAIDATGDPLPEATLQAAKSADAILMGKIMYFEVKRCSVGGPKWGVNLPVRPEQGLLRLRKELGLYANIRPANFASESLVANSPLKESVAKGVDFIVIRELIGGLYFGQRKEQNVAPDPDAAWDTMIYSVPEVQRITRVAAQIAMTANPPLAVHSIDKANVLASSRLWRRVVTDTLEKEYPQLSLDHHLVDSAAMVIVSNPKKLNGVILTENMFGDILSDQSSVIPGSLGLLPSASLASPPLTGPSDTTAPGLYEPIHGSAPDIAGQGIANPIGTILSAAMLLRYSLGLEQPAQAVEVAVRKVLDDKNAGGLGLRTKDLGGDTTSSEVGDRVVLVLKTLL
ncbi:Isopropylmalate dehydrogenase-like domain-containing protein, partial [Gautieria morchelliformis]